MNEYQDLWNQTREKLQSNLNEVTFQQTFSDVKHVIKEEKGVIYVMTPSTFIKSKINNLYVRQISEILQTLTNKTLKFKFVTEEEMNSKPKLHYDIPFISKSNLNQNYTFESFVIGESNRLSYLTAVKVAEQPGTIFNPLYIFGGVGLGKTHLMQAIGNYISESNLDYKILYVQASEFIEDYARATRDNKLQTFEEKYGNLDLLLVDDIQMLAKGKSSQEEFFKLFEEMTYRQRQIIITSDRLPEQLNGMMDRLTSRFQRGMRVEINQPDLTQRINILKRKLSETSQLDLDDEVLNYIAENFTDNVRELEGALTRVLWVSEVYNQKPTLSVAVEALDILMKAKKPTTDNNYENALSVIASMYGIKVVDLLGNSRSSKYVLPRHIAMYILKTHYKLTYSKIGAIFNGRDHTTAMNGYMKIENDRKSNHEIQMAIDSILKKV